jgi:formiminoglutamase
MNHDQPSLPTIWQSRPDALPGSYYFQKVNCLDPMTPFTQPQPVPTAILLGFASDEGIKRNHGRVGARRGPNAIRQQLARMAWHHQRLQLFDGGDIQVVDSDLNTAQHRLAERVAVALRQQCLSVVLGGGHELAWGHYQGIRQAYPTARLGIINFDAHFDLRRPPQTDMGTSGTSFWQIAQDCRQRQLPFDYFCLGIQPTGNTADLFATADRFQVRYYTAQQLLSRSDIAWQLLKFIAQVDMVYVSICLDVFAQAIAPGVSATQPAGLPLRPILPLLKLIANSQKIIAGDIAELSPPLDIDHRTAKLAAYLLDYCLISLYRAKV